MLRVAESPFQSTHPVWGGTVHTKPIAPGGSISIHPPRVGWDLMLHRRSLGKIISIHPPRVGWDRLLLRREYYGTISIHPPRVGWDRRNVGGYRGNIHFNPPTPCGVGPTSRSSPTSFTIFQSTHPVWGGTRPGPSCWGWSRISIHPPRVGWDLTAWVTGMSLEISIHPPRVGWDPSGCR